MRKRWLLSVLLVPALALAAPASAQTAQPSRPGAEDADAAQARAEAWQAYGLRVARALARSDGARDLALAAVLDAMARPPGEGAGTGDEARRWRAEAASKGAGDVITQQLLLAAGLVGGSQDEAAEAARRWQALEPGNLAPVMLQGLGTEAVLAAAARANHNRPDPYPLQRWIAGALRAHPPTAAEWSAFGEGERPSDAVHAAIWAASFPALLLPDYRDVLAACTGRPLRAAGRAEACRRMADLLLARPQTVLDERIGLSLAGAQADAATAAALDARARGVDWRQEQLRALAQREDGGDDALLARLLADPAIDSEDAMARRMLAEAGMAQEPPAEWRAPWQRRR
ncbi:MAG: hypothetical protein GX856_07695 [Gammaproteobacteria bacterium]|nr:hypothetical protein [Gammaproteobacteria bacterium]